MKKYFAIILLLLLQNSNIFAQKDKILRAELPVAESHAPFSVINFQEKGVFVHSYSTWDKKVNNSQQNFYFFDKYLLRKWKQSLILPDDYCVLTSKITEHNICLTICNSNIYKEKKPFYRLNFDIYTGDCSFDTITNLKLSKLSDYEILDVKEDRELLHFLCADKKRRDNELFYLAIDMKGNEVKSLNVKYEDINPIAAKIAFKEDKIFIFGTYNSSKSSLRFSSYDNIIESTGIFSAEISDNDIAVVSKLNFKDFSAVPDNYSYNTKNIFDRLRKSSKNEISMDLLVNFEVLEKNGQFMLLAESFNREVTEKTEMYYDYYGRVIPYTTIIFDGYSYNDAFFVLFDDKANIIANKNIDLSSIKKSMTLWQHSNILPDIENPVLLFVDAVHVSYCDIFTDKIFSLISLKSTYNNDAVQDEYNSKISWWYDNFILISGYQSIQNKHLKSGTKRNVFFLSKMLIE